MLIALVRLPRSEKIYDPPNALSVLFIISSRRNVESVKQEYFARNFAILRARRATTSLFNEYIFRIFVACPFRKSITKRAKRFKTFFAAVQRPCGIIYAVRNRKRAEKIFQPSPLSPVRHFTADQQMLNRNRTPPFCLSSF